MKENSPKIANKYEKHVANVDLDLFLKMKWRTKTPGGEKIQKNR